MINGNGICKTLTLKISSNINIVKLLIVMLLYLQLWFSRWRSKSSSLQDHCCRYSKAITFEVSNWMTSFWSTPARTKLCCYLFICLDKLFGLAGWLTGAVGKNVLIRLTQSSWTWAVTELGKKNRKGLNFNHNTPSNLFLHR